MFKRILVALDGSTHSQRSFEYAQDLTLKYSAQLVLVHAFGPIPRELGSPIIEQIEAHAVEEGKHIVERAQAQLANMNLNVTTEILEGPAAEAILRVADTYTCDLIVLGSRGLGTFEGLLLGSVSNTVLQHAKIPVLIVK